MEATALSVGKSVLNGALGYAKSALAEEVALQLGVQRDHAFIRDELEMMLAFLMAAHDERDEHKVVKTWVKQVRDVAYDAEDSLEDFAVRLGKKSWWRVFRTLLDRHRVAKQMKELRAKVEDVSQRNVRYCLIKGPVSKGITSTGQSNMASETMSSTEEVRRQHEKAKLDLIQLINMKDENLRVISVWGTCGVPQETSIIKMAYDDLLRKKFEYHAWIRIMHPFNQAEFVQNIIEQFYVNILDEATKTNQKLTPEAQDLWRIWMMNGDDLVDEFKKILNEKSYLVVLADLSSMEVWDHIKTCFPNNKNGSRFIVCTEQIKVASLCVGTEIAPPEHKQLFVDQSLYAFYEKVSQVEADSIEEPSSSNTMKELRAKVEDVSQRNVRYHLIKGPDSKPAIGTGQSSMMTGETMSGMEEARKEKDKAKVDLIRLINKMDENLQVIAIWGPSYVLQEESVIKLAYNDLKRRKKFECHALIQIMHPFVPTEFLKNIVRQFLVDSLEETVTMVQQEYTPVAQDLRRMGTVTESDFVDAFKKYLKEKRYLIVLTDLSSVEEWDRVKALFPSNNKGSRLIVCAKQVEVASLCVGSETALPEHKRFSSNQVLFYAFYEKDSQGGTNSTGEGSSSNTMDNTSSMEEARKEKDKAKVDLIRLINKKDDNLRVIGLWGTSGFLHEASIIKLAYDDLKRRKKFECHALVKIMHPFSPVEFLQNIIRQFYVHSLEETTTTTQQESTHGAQDLRRMGMMTEGDLVDAFKEYLNDKRYLIVLSDLSNIDEWDQIKECFPSNKKGSRLIVCAEQAEVASLCVEPEAALPEHKQLCSNQILYAFYEKGSQGGTDSIGEGSSSNITDNFNSKSSLEEKGLTRMDTTLAAFKESQLIGREKDISEIIRKISNRHSQEFEVISICGMGSLGKTTLVKHVYQSQELNAMFEKCACVTIKRPFNPRELIGSLVAQLHDKQEATQLHDKKEAAQLGDKQEADGGRLEDLLQGKSYLIILDDISSTKEWDAVVEYFPATVPTSRIVVTTREEKICNHCSKKGKNIYKLELLQDEDAHKLFIEKVFGTAKYSDEQYTELADETKLSTWSGFLAKQPKTLMEWRKFTEHISADLEMNTELQRIPNILIKSYEGLPYHLKSCFLYMSIFPEDYNISRRRLVQRWTAEGYSSEVRGKSLEEIADSYFMELIDRSVILPVRKSIPSGKGIESCQLHDLMREISISRAMDENLVFRLEEGTSSSNT